MAEIKSMKMPEHRCTRCLDEMNAMAGNRVPKVNDYTVCTNCGHVIRIGESFRMLEVDIAQIVKDFNPTEILKVYVTAIIFAKKHYAIKGFYASTIFQDLGDYLQKKRV